MLDADGNGVPDGCENAPNCPGDADGSGTVDVQDLIEVIVAWGRSGGAADLNGDGAIDVQDLVLVIVNWNSSCGAVARNAR